MTADRCHVLGIPVDPVSTADVLSFVRRCIGSRRSAQIATINVEFIMRARRDATFRRVLESADLTTADSAGVLWALRRQGVHMPYRVGGSDLVWSLSLQAAEFGHRIFILGGRPGVADAAGARLQRRYPGLRIAGVHSGSPAPSEAESIVDLIRRSDTDILFVAFGAPQQEIWIARHLTQTGARCAMGVGGSIDYVAGTASRAPVWVRRHNLDWLWRLVTQPWRWRRMLVLPQFAWLVWRTKQRVRRREYEEASSRVRRLVGRRKRGH